MEQNKNTIAKAFFSVSAGMLHCTVHYLLCVSHVGIFGAQNGRKRYR